MRQRIEDQVSRLLDCYERSAMASTRDEVQAIEAEAKVIIKEMAIDGLMLFHGINEHLGRIAIALEQANRPVDRELIPKL